MESEISKNVLNVQVSSYAACNRPNGKPTNLYQWLTTQNAKIDLEELRKKENFSELKKTVLPAITVSGLFNGSRKAVNLIEHTKLICIDIDAKEQQKPMNEIFNQIKQLDFIAYLGKSCSGKGLFAIIPISNSEKHKEHLQSLIEYFDNMGIILDKSCADVCRLRLYSYDKDAYYNLNAAEYYGISLLKTAIPPKQSQTISDTKTNDVPKTIPDTSIKITDKRVIKVINGIKYNHLNIAEDYYVWMKIGMALYNTFGEEGRALYHIISSQSKKYDPDECNRNYDEMGYYKYEDVSIKTLFYYYNQAKKAVAQRQ